MTVFRQITRRQAKNAFDQDRFIYIYPEKLDAQKGIPCPIHKSHGEFTLLVNLYELNNCLNAVMGYRVKYYVKN